MAFGVDEGRQGETCHLMHLERETGGLIPQREFRQIKQREMKEGYSGQHIINNYCKIKFIV